MKDPDEELRVAFLTVGDTSRLTGGYLYNARILEGLRERGVDVTEVVPCGASQEEQEASAPDLATLNPADFDVLVVDALACTVAAPWLDLWRRERPVVALVHELPSVAAPGTNRALEEPLLRADRLVTVSVHGKKILESREAPAGRTVVVPPGFDRLDPAAVEVDHDVHRGGVVALCVAQWIERKGILDLVKAWKRRERPDAILRLLGENEADPGYADRVRAEIGDSPGILVEGAVDDVALEAAYYSADFFVLPSRYEGYGVVYAEALAVGLPVVACEVGPVPELVGEDAAILVPPDDVEALSAAIDLLMEDPDLRTRMSAAAFHRAARLPSWRDTVEGFHEVLRSVAGDFSGRVA